MQKTRSNGRTDVGRWFGMPVNDLRPFDKALPFVSFLRHQELHRPRRHAVNDASDSCRVGDDTLRRTEFEILVEPASATGFEV